MAKKSMRVPKTMQAKYDEVVALTDAFCAKHLNDEYAEVIRYAVAAMSRKKPSPLEKGKAESWACGFAHAVGFVNFLFDRSQSPSMSASDLYKAFGVGESTGQGKSKAVRDLLGMGQMDPDWCLPSKLYDNPKVWVLSVNGLLVDVRYMPREVQVQAFEEGLIPYVPADKSRLCLS